MFENLSYDVLLASLWIWPLIFMLSGIIVGAIFEKLVFPKLIAISLRTKWEGDDIVLTSLRRYFVLWFALAGFYGSHYYCSHSRLRVRVAAAEAVDMTAPLAAQGIISDPASLPIAVALGLGFGFFLERAGFGNSRKLAAQFYLYDMSVLKVMFTAIVTAMVLLFGAVGLGILDFSQVWVNPTYLWSGILGGLIMGVGYIDGGFCPTTSLASASTGKIDGMLFMLGGFVDAFLFGETEQYFTNWYNNAGYYGRVTLDQVFGIPVGWVVLLVVLMALFMFWGSEQLERIVGKKDMSKEPKLRLVGAGALVVLALAVVFLGTP